MRLVLCVKQPFGFRAVFCAEGYLASLWKSGVGNGGHLIPVPFKIGRETCSAIRSRRTFTIVEADEGKELWTTPRLQPIGVNASDPVLEGAIVFFTAV